MQSKGSSLVYSAFKTIEGIGVFAMALEVNGFSPIRLIGSDDNPQLSPETIESFENDPEGLRYIIYSGSESFRFRQTLINIFNMRLDKLPQNISKYLQQFTEERNLHGQVCRAFMITGAGAEGLSLKNVRTVHIMEPFWNKVRTDQVKGRAVRICSHSELPYSSDPAMNERTVEIFTYISVFKTIYKDGKAVKKCDETIVINDDSKTTDEYILSLSNAKEKLSSSFLKAVQSGAVDCQLNAFENENVTCFVQEGGINDFMYDPRLIEDIATTAQKEKQVVVERKGYKIGGITYVGIQQGTKTVLFDMKNTTFENPLGELAVVDGKPKVTWREGKGPKKA